MEQYIVYGIAIAILVIGVGSSFTAALLMWTVRIQIKRIDDLEISVDEVKTNYIDRFEEVKNLINLNNSEAKTELAKVSVTLAKITTKMGISDNP